LFSHKTLFFYNVFHTSSLHYNTVIITVKMVFGFSQNRNAENATTIDAPQGNSNLEQVESRPSRFTKEGRQAGAAMGEKIPIITLWTVIMLLWVGLFLATIQDKYLGSWRWMSS